MASDFASRRRDYLDALYEALAGGSAVRDQDPITLLQRLVSRAAPWARTRAAATATFDGLAAIASARTPDAAAEMAATTFAAPEAFREAIFFARCLERDAATALALLDARAYIQAASVPDSLVELNTDRRAVLDAATFAALWQEPSRSSWMDGLISLWRRDYVGAYARAHEAYRAAVVAITDRIGAETSRAAALERLNGLARLGTPVGVAALAQIRHFEALSACSLAPADLLTALADGPICPACGIALGAQAPAADARRAVTALNRALTAQQARLSRRVVSRILARQRAGADERVDDFLRVLQASDVAGLALVLDDDLVEFLRDLLDAPAVENVLANLALAYPEVTPANLDAAVAAFRALLETAIERAGGRVRLSEGQRP